MSVCRGLEGKQASRQTGAKTDLDRQRRGRRKDTDGVERNETVGRQTQGQTEEIRWAGTRQDTAERLVGRHGGCFTCCGPT